MNGKPHPFPCHLKHAGSSGFSGDTLLNAEKQSHIDGDFAGNNHANNKINAHNTQTNNDTTHNGDTYIFNFLTAVSIPPSLTTDGIRRNSAELLNANRAEYQPKRGRREMPALHYAAEVGDETEVERILKCWRVERLPSGHMRDVGEKDKQGGMNPLHYATKRGNQTILRLILSYHAERARFELHSRSVKNGKQPSKNLPQSTPPIELEDEIKSLLVSKSKRDGMNALHYAAACGHDVVAKVLLEAGADIQGKCSWAGMNAMHYAASLGHVNVLSLLKSHLDTQENTRDKPDSQKRSEKKAKQNPHKPSMGKHPPAPVPEENSGNSIPNAQENGWNTVPAKKGRRRRPSKPNREDNREQKAAWREMLETKSKNNGMTPLHFAASNGRNTAVKFLIGCGARIDTRCRSNEMKPIHFAAKYGHVTTMRLLHDHSADINAFSGREGMTPLHYAAQMGHEDVVKFLCSNNANFMARCRWHQMIPLHYAARNNHEVVVRMLVLYHHSSTPLKDSHERTAAQYAQENGSESMKHFLNHYYRG